MKKTFITLLIITGFSTSSFAQFFLGLQGGVNISSLSRTSLADLKTKLGYHAGIIFNTPSIAKHFSIMPSVLYSTKGFQYDYTLVTTATVPDTSGGTVTSTVTETANVDATLGYIDIPVMFTYFTSSEPGGLFIQAGPQLSILITDKSVISTNAEISTNGGAPQPTTPTISHEINYNATDVSLTGGIGYKFPKFLFLYVRASTGFLKVQKDGFIKDANAGHNIVYQAGIALTFL